MIKSLANKTLTIKPSQWLSMGIIAMITISHVLIYLLMPYSCDDYWYMTPLRDYCMGIDTSFPINGLWDCWKYHFQNDNIRLANIVFTLFLLIPKIIPSIISGLLVGAILWLASKLSGINSHNPLLMSIMAFMLSFMLPWYEQMFTLCFAFNYIWASALTLWLAYLFFYKEKIPNVFISLLLGFIMGAWHEGFSLPLLVGFIIYAIFHQQVITKSHSAIILGLILGLVWLAQAPGLQSNLGYRANLLDFSTILQKLVLYHIPLFLLLLSTIITIIHKNTRRFIFEPLFVSLISICLTGVTLNLIMNIGVRTGWMGYLFGIISTLYLCAKTFNYNQPKSILKYILTIIISLTLIVHFTIVIFYTIKVKHEFEYVLEEYHKSPDGVVFADITYDYQAAPFAWKKPYFENFTYIWNTFWIDNYYNYNKKLRVIPTCLSDAENLDATKVNGDNPFMIYNGFLYAPIIENKQIAKNDFYEIDFGYTKAKLACTNFTFSTKKGNRYYFSFPQRSTIHRWIGEIKEINKIN